jgi:hypothetical protein
MTDSADLAMLRQDLDVALQALAKSDKELTDVRRCLCAEPDETAHQAARRVVYRGLQVRLKVGRLVRRLDLQNAELDLLAQEFRETLASDLQELLIP